jgi:biopolymer transport protein ExbD
MPKVKVPRKHISLDMTAMCDMAFLLLTFFMLTTKFKPQQDIEVLTPSSVSETKIPEKNLMLISVDQSGKVFLKIADEVKNGLISKVSEEYHINLSNQEKQKLADMSAFGAPLAALKSVVKTSSKDGMKIGDQPGIPCDSSNNELSIWIKNARLASPKLRFAIKGDKQVNYEVVDKVIATLQDENINKFNLITTMKMKQN